ncbi:MAG: hypothetical protein A3C85_01185 [Candidatus Doudnabacteria bacterium RIFCSPHIGHO2_02_FULL_48_21]|uniref:Uncharacterized protein n=1 Tax=Candidatus Doudnabacteria bacterium RIFCSPLOWO2_02_FULL_48_13 TaxID=1817845 RepID=A0A1F5Q911_9BACT|nr:MAG: hypothetical protein A3K05_04230 [Candidatus Doudnabacteria bacterium RIFCSPHIGHO2_01_48_18]OGE79572.1 MAG: hypothetical protein A2668_03240 [Candidatus Doudnabacteria bacterium RIFCSPHIGHO2_01_FULL_48_180]OGE91099.1 MAG: hypothetical protein A3F44_02125 [Candidatus Doudnabacteria bacterium RIFCSPHIGHO2_12_FULL_47_25]OGE93789.1 MAG: hypothetical protein A3C85_01185 [Candidatus Doudnabacteria bacterium RIFCSPHIGHO2_02_FULL_48_21]OGE97975.1 MAG: hypothetical protein A3A83_00770 [Candidatu
MNEVLQSEVFFFITSIAVIVLTGLAVGVLVYFISVVKDLKHVARVARREADHIASDLADFRAENHLPNFLKKIFNRRHKIKIKH